MLTYNEIFLQINDLKYSTLFKELNNLYYKFLASFLKNKFNDTRSLEELVNIIKEEYSV